MPNLKYYNTTTSQWETLVVGAKGETGEQGPVGPQGPVGLGSVVVNSPITNSGTTTAANLGLDYNALQNGRNVIINGAFDIWQRGTSFSSPASGTYTADRFTQNFDGTGATRTITRELFSPGSAPATSEIGTFHYRYAQSVAGSGGTYLNVFQHYVENVRTFSGQTVTYSIWAKAAAPGNYVMGIGQNFGDGGSAFTGAGGQTIAVTTSWQRFSLTVTMPSISGKTVGTNSKLDVYVQATPNTTFTIDIWGVQLEAGAVATPFKRNAPSIQAELAACQRYYQRYDFPANGAIGMVGAFESATVATIFPLACAMRVAPSASGSGSLFTFRAGGFINKAASALSFTTRSNFVDLRLGGGGFNLDSVYILFGNPLTLEFSAEL